MNHRIAPAALASVAALAALSSSSEAVTLSSIDYTAREGTSWASSTVRVDLGAGVGMATIRFDSINSGSFEFFEVSAYNAAPYSSSNAPTLLGSGDLFSPTQEVIFRLQPGSGPGLGGFRMTVTLDGGVFPEGSVFSVRSLGMNASGKHQEMRIVSGMAAADPLHLPTDDVWGKPPLLTETSPGTYGTLSTGSNSTGRAFEIAGNSFSVEFLGDYVGGGEAFTLSLAPVPEPSFSLIALASIGAGALIRRR